ncbi:MAG: HEPN domain-containing protein [Elusimicrobiota bacterium]
MVPKHKTKDVAKSLYVNYLKKAEECFKAAKTSCASKEWNAATINAIHSCISACDAVCVYFLGKRHSGESHGDAVKLFKTIKTGKEIDTNAGRLTRILSIKNIAEYEERLIFQKECDKVLRDCERFLDFIKKQLP